MHMHMHMHMGRLRTDRRDVRGACAAGATLASDAVASHGFLPVTNRRVGVWVHAVNMWRLRRRQPDGKHGCRSSIARVARSREGKRGSDHNSEVGCSHAPAVTPDINHSQEWITSPPAVLEVMCARNKGTGSVLRAVVLPAVRTSA